MDKQLSVTPDYAMPAGEREQVNKMKISPALTSQEVFLFFCDISVAGRRGRKKFQTCMAQGVVKGLSWLDYQEDKDSVSCVLLVSG